MRRVQVLTGPILAVFVLLAGLSPALAEQVEAPTQPEPDVAIEAPLPSIFDAAAYASPLPVDPRTASPGVAGSIVRLYHAVFGRSPDGEGLNYWVGRYLEGARLAQIAEAFMASPEWAATYGEVDAHGFVSLLYGNVLGRAPDEEGQNFWLGQLLQGKDPATLLLGFSESPEFVVRTGTASPEKPPPPPAPAFPAPPAASGQGRRIVYSNSQQRVWLIEADDTIVDSYPVSGRRNTPRPGRYAVYSKSEKAWAGHDGITMNHMVRFARGSRLAIGFHSIPRYRNGQPMQTETQLGSYRSAGCVRQRDDLALALFAWAPIGTPVFVTP